MDQNKKLIGFYGGTIGPWIPMITMIILMIISTATHTGGLNRVVLIAFVCLALGSVRTKSTSVPSRSRA